MSLESADRDRRRVGFPGRSGMCLALLVGVACATSSFLWPLPLTQATVGGRTRRPRRHERRAIALRSRVPRGPRSRAYRSCASPPAPTRWWSAPSRTRTAGEAETLVVGHDAGPYTTTYQTLLHFPLAD